MAMDGTKTIFLGGVVMFGAFTKDGSTFYVARQGTGDWMSAVDIPTAKSRQLPLPTEGCRNAHAIQLSPDERTAIVICEGDHGKVPGAIAYIDTEGFAFTGSVDVGLFADGAAWLPAAP
jgi:hypothetical protein